MGTVVNTTTAGRTARKAAMTALWSLSSAMAMMRATGLSGKISLTVSVNAAAECAVWAPSSTSQLVGFICAFCICTTCTVRHMHQQDVKSHPAVIQPKAAVCCIVIEDLLKNQRDKNVSAMNSACIFLRGRFMVRRIVQMQKLLCYPSVGQLASNCMHISHIHMYSHSPLQTKLQAYPAVCLLHAPALQQS